MENDQHFVDSRFKEVKGKILEIHEMQNREKIPVVDCPGRISAFQGLGEWR
jgi:hypothetical protein